MQDFKKEQIEFMRQACLMCDNSSLDVRTGCVIVLGGKVLAGGWNETKNYHAEKMAVDSALERGHLLCGASVYVTRFPCVNCAKMFVSEDVSRVYYMSDHFTSGNEALPILEQAGVLVKHIPEEAVWADKN